VGLDELLGAPSAPRPAQQGRDIRYVAAARTPPRRMPGMSRSCVHRDVCCTAGARRASRPAVRDARAGSCGGCVIHEPSVQRTNSPTAGMKPRVGPNVSGFAYQLAVKKNVSISG
jgi:hypothetical protein